MSEQIKHECGLAFVRLRKPLAYYHDKYGTALYGLNKMYLLMQKQHNRGQDGAGLLSLKLNMPPGGHAMHRERSIDKQAIRVIFDKVFSRFEKVKEHLHDAKYLKDNVPFAGQIMLGHLRYGTHGNNTADMLHPHLRMNNWRTRTLALAGNFNMTNVDELFQHLVELGQHPSERADTVTVLERIGHFLDEEVQRLFDEYRNAADRKGNREITELIGKNLDILKILRRAAKRFDGGYVMGGVFGHGDAFVMRDPNGIRPAYYYYDDEVVVVASERPAILTAMNLRYDKVQELPAGHALIVKADGTVSIEPFVDAAAIKPIPCSFERIYFSRGNDREIYGERKQLGYQLTKTILEAVNYDFENTVFSYIPNTAETAFRGLQHGIEDALNAIKIEKIKQLNGGLTPTNIEKILSIRPRFETIAVKDVKLRTFISEDSSRNELVSHVYDVTYGIVNDDVDTLVILDDSIVRGTTLRESILRILSRLVPKKIIVVSSAPPIRYPDCYGIDMSRMADFVAFQALLKLLDKADKNYLLDEAYEQCVAHDSLPIAQHNTNFLKPLYDLFTDEELEQMIAKIITPANILPEIQVIYQRIEGLHTACPKNLGDWYFSGNYPTPGGYRVVNRAFMNFMKGVTTRAY